MRNKLLSLLFLLSTALPLRAACPTGTCSTAPDPVTNDISASVIAAVAQAGDGIGDIITIPNGTFKWTNNVVINKVLTLKGAGQTAGTPVAPTDGSGVWQTVVTDETPSGIMLQGRMKANWRSGPGDNKAPIRITGIEFKLGSVTKSFGQDNAQPVDPYSSGGLINFAGHDQRTDSQFRFDHCKWNNLNGVMVTDTVTGLIDNCNITFVASGSGSVIYPKGSWWQSSGSTGGQRWGDGSRADGVHWGSDEFVYVERNLMTRLNSPLHYGFTDMFGQSRIVWRDNTMIDGSLLSHGTEGSGGGRTGGMRATEIYRNTFTSANGQNLGSNALIDLRSGTSTIWGNTISAYTGSRVGMATYRTYNGQSNAGFGGATGRNDFDVNSGPYALNIPGQADNFTGRCDTATPLIAGTGNVTINVSPTPSPAWIADQWKGYTIVNTSGRIPAPDSTKNQQQDFSVIEGNTNSAITYHGPFGAGKGVNWAVGEPFKIYRVDWALDQPGRGGGTALNPSNPATVPGNWVGNLQNQVTELNYVWGNSPEFSYATTGTNLIVGTGANASIRPLGTPRPGYAPLPSPHPLVSLVSTVPTLNGGQAFFIKNGTVDCASNSNCFAITTSGFSAAPVITIASGSLPANVAFADATPVAGSARVSGPAATAVTGDYVVQLHAVNGAQTADAALAINVTALNVPPATSITAPTAGAIFTTADNVTVNTTASDQNGDATLTQLQILDGATVLKTCGTVPVTSCSYTGTFSAGAHSLTSKATDNASSVTTSSPAVVITVTTVPAAPTPPASIQVSP